MVWDGVSHPLGDTKAAEREAMSSPRRCSIQEVKLPSSLLVRDFDEDLLKGPAASS